MEYNIDVVPYTPESGIRLKWDPEFEIEVTNNSKEIVIVANKDGLISLARHLLTLAQNNVPSGSHIHLDQWSGLEEDSTEIILVRK